MTTSSLRPAIVAAKQRLALGREKLRRQHDAGSPGVQVCTLLTDLLDGVVLDLYEAAKADAEAAGEFPQEVSLVAHGGFGRREVAPYSDVDLMLLIAPGSEKHVEGLARRLSQSIFDCGLQLGFSVRTPSQASQMAFTDATVCTALAESRFLGGSVQLFTKFMRKFRRDAARRARSLLISIENSRRDEWKQHGGTVNLLEPNVKRSRGGLRDIQLVRWIGFVRYGESNPEALQHADHLSKADFQRLRHARDFLLRVRNELHFQANKSHDMLDKGEQLRIAAKFGYTGDEAILPVERFMREYFEHTNEVRNVAAHALANARPRFPLSPLFTPLVSHLVERDFRVGPLHIAATRRGLRKVTSDLAQVLRLMTLANLYNKRIEHDTWEAIRTAMIARSETPVTAEAIQSFLDLMSQPAQLGELLRGLHELRVLEKIIPAVKHARCLLQFNEYHKYTVDEHSIRAVQAVTDFQHDTGTLGEVYRNLKHKRILHLALLLHDLGKGYVEDHSEVGLRIATETAERLQLNQRETEILTFLVHKHLQMSHLAFRRDLNDEQVVVKFAIEVGSPEVLQMLYLLTAADLAAVGPGVLNQWKLELLTELYQQTLRHLAGEAAVKDAAGALEHLRAQLAQLAPQSSDRAWWERQIAVLPGWYLREDPLPLIRERLEQLHQLPRGEVMAAGRYVAERNAIEYTIGVHEDITPGIFHKLTGALTSKGKQILSASIAPLADGLVLDRFFVTDGDFNGEPPQGRLDEVCAALVAALKDQSERPPTFRRLWQSRPMTIAPGQPMPPQRVRIDNNTAERYTILDIFAHDRMGLLYTITRTIFELGLSVHLAKIATYVDQVLDVFYVTENDGRKIVDEGRLKEIRARILEAIEQR